VPIRARIRNARNSPTSLLKSCNKFQHKLFAYRRRLPSSRRRLSAVRLLSIISCHSRTLISFFVRSVQFCAAFFSSVSSSSEVSQLTQVSQVIEGTVPVVADSQSPSYSSVISHQKEGENQENEMVDAADAFASNELVGERKIIDKPALPAGFLLQPFKLKEEAPITQKPHDIITSEPIFKQATPLRKLGDMVWPPKSGSSNNGEVVMSQDAIPSRRQQKNYQSFFGQHQLNASFPMYRAPPGTQHFGLEEGENATPM